MGFSYRYDNLEGVERSLARRVNALQDASPLMTRVASALEGSTRRRFDDQEAPDGQRWPPSLRARIKGGKTLLDSGLLRGSITSDHDRRSAVVGTNKIYALVHQIGATIKAKAGGFLKFAMAGIGWRQLRSVTMPARPFVGVSEDDRLEIAEQVEAYLAEVDQ